VTEDVLIRAVLAAPDDELPRQQYADWLEENAAFDVPCPYCSGEGCATHGHGDWSKNCNGTGLIRRGNGYAQRAEFIRLQIRQEAKGVPRCGEVGPRNAAACPDCQRERELLQPWKVWEWAGDAISRLAGPGSPDCVVESVGVARIGSSRVKFRRGFVERVECTLWGWERYGPRVVRESPLRTALLQDVRSTEGDVGLYRNTWAAPSLRNVDDVPSWLFDRLKGGRLDTEDSGVNFGGAWRWYESASEVEDDVSQAALTWAKSVDPDDPMRLVEPQMIMR